MVALRTLFLFGSGVCAVDVHPHKAVAHSIGHIEVGLVHTFKSDCWKKRPVAWVQHGSVIKKVSNPGAGMNPDDIEPFTTVLKDGYAMSDCIKDAMYEHGDKHGDNANQYKMGDIANVSIIHYTEIVPKEDQEDMTHQVCFEFCRTVPDMTFFGINNGRDCYCAPYYKPMAGSSDECDAPCPGKPGQMCGGKTKSSVFSMHMCADTDNDLETAVTNAGDLLTSLDELTADMKETVEAGEEDVNEFQESFGKAGDAAASDLMQSAKIWAGKLLHARDDGADVSEELTTVKGKGEKMKGKDFTNSDTLKNAEENIKEMQKLTSKGEESLEELTEMFELAHPSAEAEEDAEEDAASQYYPIMYFIDKEFEEVPQTCGGDTLNEPIFGKSQDECAMACDELVGKCVGFSYFEKDTIHARKKEEVCFLFEKFKTVQYYTGCESDSSKGKFLQTTGRSNKRQGPFTITCRAKLNLFEGTTLKPDKSGKCDMCLKEATKADRCFESPQCDVSGQGGDRCRCAEFSVAGCVAE